MLTEFDKGRRIAIASEEQIQQNQVTGKKTRVIRTNCGSIAQRLQAILATRQMAQDFALFEPDQNKVPDKIAALRAGLPEVTGP